MARPPKPGLEYYPQDTDLHSDRKIRKLLTEFGAKGYLIYDYLKCLIYRDNGYWVRYDAELNFDIADALKCGIDEQLVGEVITGCLRYGLLDEGLFQVSNILTSAGIQRRYLKAKRGAVIAEKMRVITEETGVIAVETPVNAAISTQSKVKEIKEEEIGDKSPSGEAELSPAEEQISIEELKKQYSKLVKNKRSLFDFVSIHKPPFIQPYLDLWNVWAAERSKPQVMEATDKRKGHLRARLQEKSFDFIKILTAAANSPVLLKGKWFTYDWFMKSKDNYVKILEGNYQYDDEQKQRTNPKEELNDADQRLLQRLDGKG